MKKFYETPAVEFTGFNAEDVITTSANIDTLNVKYEGEVAENFNTAVKGISAANYEIADYSTYQW